MSSEFPTHLHLNLQQNGTSFKRTFEQFGYDSGPPMSSALQASGSGAGNHHVPTSSTSNGGGNERNKRARSTSSSSLSDRSADSSRSSEYNTARSSASLSEGSSSNQNLSLDHNMRSPDYTFPIVASPSSTCTMPTPASALPTPESQDESMSDSSGFSLDIPRPPPPPPPSQMAPATTHDTLRSTFERFSEFDSNIAALRRSHSRSPSWIRAASPAQPPLPSSNVAPEPFDNWGWPHFGDPPTSSHTSGADPRHRFSTDVTSQYESVGTYTAVPRRGASLSLQASDHGLSRPGNVAPSSNTSSSTSSLTVHARPPFRLSTSSRPNTFSRESSGFLNSLTESPESRESAERDITDAFGSRQGVDHSSSGSSNLPLITLPLPRASPAPISPDAAQHSELLDSVFAGPPSNLLPMAQGARRSVQSGIGSRTMNSTRPSVPSASTSAALPVFAEFYAGNEEPRRGTSNTFENGNDSPHSLSAGRHEEHAARARTLPGHTRNSGRPLSEIFASFDREQAAQDSGEAEPSLDSFLPEDSEDERARRMFGHHVHNVADEDNDDDDDDDDSHPERAFENLHNARDLLERSVETARSLSGLPPRPEPHLPQPYPRLRSNSHLYPSATTVSSNSLVSESAAEHRRTNARAQLRSEMFNSRPNLDEPSRDASEFASLTAATRLRRLIANQTDSNVPSRPPSSGRTNDHSSRPASFNGYVLPSQLSRGGLDERERVQFAEILSDRRHPHTGSGNDGSSSRDRNHVSPEDSLDNIFHPVFGQVGSLPEFLRSAEGETQPPYVYRPPTPPLDGLRTHSRSPTITRDPSARSHPFSNVDLNEFPPGIYRDSLRRSIQANQGRSAPRMPEPTSSYEPPTFSLGNSDEDDDSDDMDSYFGVMRRHGRREHTAARSARFPLRRRMPDPTLSTTTLASGVDSHDRPPSTNAYLGSRGRIPPLRGHPSEEFLARHRMTELERGLPNSPLDPLWSSGRREVSMHDPRPPSWEGSEAHDSMRTIRDLMDRYGSNDDRFDLASRRDIPPPHQGSAPRPGNPNRHSLLPWRSSLHFHGSSSSTGSGSPSNSRSSSGSSSDHNLFSARPRERQEPAPPEERTPIRSLRQRAGLIRGAPRPDGTRIRSMFRTMARRNMGDYVPDELFDSSYEGLLSLGETLGEARSKATPTDVIASLPTGTYQAWAKEDSDTRCPICLDDYGRDDIVTKLIECTHWLHKTCMEQWLKTANTCPVCRKKVKGSPKCSFKPNPVSTTSSGVAGGSASRAPESGTSGGRNRSDSTSGVNVSIRFSDLISRARRGSNAQSGTSNQQQSSSRVPAGDVIPTESRFGGGSGTTHYHHYHYHYLHIHPPRPDQSQRSQFSDPYRQPPSLTPSTAQTGTGPRSFPNPQNANGPRSNTSNRPALSRPTSWFGSMTGRGNARRAPEQDSSARFPSAMDYNSGFGRSSGFTSEASGFHHSIPAPQMTFEAPPSSGPPFSQDAGTSPSSSSSSSSTTVTNRPDTYPLASGELQQPFHGTSHANASSVGSRSHMTVYPNHAGSAAQHLGSFNTGEGLDSRSTTTSSGYVRPTGPGTSSGVYPWWR